MTEERKTSNEKVCTNFGLFRIGKLCGAGNKRTCQKSVGGTPCRKNAGSLGETVPTPSSETIVLAEGVTAKKQEGKLIVSAFDGDVTFEMTDPLPSELKSSFQMSEDQTTLQIELEFRAEGCTGDDETCRGLFESYSIAREAGENPMGTINGYTVSQNIIMDSLLTEENLKRYRELQGYPEGEWREGIEPVNYFHWSFDKRILNRQIKSDKKMNGRLFFFLKPENSRKKGNVAKS